MTVAEGILLGVSVVVFVYLCIAMYMPERFQGADMWDVLFIVVIVAFFVVAAIVVRLLDGMITRSGIDADPGDEAPEPEPGGRTR